MTSRSCDSFRRATVVSLGILSFGFGVWAYLNWIEMFTRLRGKEMALSPTSPAFSGWKVSPLPLYFDVYLFNWTNPEDFHVGSIKKPHFEQLGPYRFRESPDKVDIEWHAHNHSVSFRKKAIFHFDAAGSRGGLQDRITTVNAVAHGAALRVKGKGSLAKGILSGTLSMYKEDIAITKTADEWIFTGYLDPLVTMGSFFSIFSKDIEVPYDRVGWLYTRNDSATYDGHFNMYTGTDDVYKMGRIHTWNHMTHNNAYGGECGDVKGSMGEFFTPNLTPMDTVFIYLPNLCRAIPLDYSQTVQVHGVTAYKFSGGARSLDNGTLYPEAKCFCVNDKCEPSGVINIGPCKYNSSIYMSYPHFYKADPSYLSAVDGLAPDPQKHEFFMTLEPNAGVPMDVGGGFQANYLLEPVPGVRPFENIPRTFIPIMWCEERVRVTPEIASDIALVPLIVLLGQIFTSMFLAGGVILTCWYPTKFATKLLQSDPKTKAKLNPLHGSYARAQPLVPLGHLKPRLDYKNEAVVRSTGSMAEGLLNNTLRDSADVIKR